MSNKPNKYLSRLESEIEKNREESNWKKVLDLVEQIKPKVGSTGPLYVFLLGEAKLEEYLESNPPISQNTELARGRLVEAKHLLQSTVGEEGDKDGVRLDSYLLLGKINYACGKYSEALECLDKSGLDNLSKRQLALRNLRLIAESFAIKGICLEKIPPQSTSKFKLNERQDQIINCYETAADLSLLYLQELDKLKTQNAPALYSGGTTSISSRDPVGPILETAILNAPLFKMKSGNIEEAIKCYRGLLSAIETDYSQKLRFTLARQLAEILARGVCEDEYIKPEISDTMNKYRKKPVDPWKPRVYSSLNMFIPQEHTEEVVLLLFISEAMAVREAVLSQSPEHYEARKLAFENAVAVYDLLTITLGIRYQVALLSECFEHALKFSYEEAHIWTQYALSLVASRKYERAVQVLSEVALLAPTNTFVCMLSSKIYSQNLGNVEKSMEWSEMAIERETITPHGLLGKCWSLNGIGHTIMWRQVTDQGSRETHLRKAKEAFTKARDADLYDHIPEFYLGYLCAFNRQIEDAVVHVKKALSLKNDHLSSLQLLILLLSAQKRSADALRLTDTCLEEYPNTLSVLYLKAHLEEEVLGTESALITAKLMLREWRLQFEEQTKLAEETEQNDTKSVYHMYSSDPSDPEGAGKNDTLSVHANSVAVSRVEQALSEVASSLSSYQPRRGPQNAWSLQVSIWLLLAEFYIKLDQIQEASACIAEATTIFPLSHHIMYMKGLLHEYRQEYSSAKAFYENALSINPHHIKSLQHLGLVYLALGSPRLAERSVREAISLDSLDNNSWFNLGKILRSEGDDAAASDCLITAINIESSSPILPFSTIPICYD